MGANSKIRNLEQTSNLPRRTLPVFAGSIKRNAVMGAVDNAFKEESRPDRLAQHKAVVN